MIGYMYTITYMLFLHTIYVHTLCFILYYKLYHAYYVDGYTHNIALYACIVHRNTYMTYYTHSRH